MRAPVGDNRRVILLTGIAIAIFLLPDAWRLPVIVGFALLEAAETAITWWISRRRPPKVGVETLIGATGRAVTECRPRGTVRVRGEVWDARCESGADADARVRIVGRDRLTLLVEPEEAE